MNKWKQIWFDNDFTFKQRLNKRASPVDREFDVELVCGTATRDSSDSDLRPHFEVGVADEFSGNYFYQSCVLANLMFISQALALENFRTSVVAGEEVAPAIEAELDSLLLRRRAEGLVDQFSQVNLWQILVRLE